MDSQPAYNDLPLPTAYLIAILLESVFWGIYVVLFGICVWILVAQRQGAISKAMLIPACVLFAFSTMHIAVGWLRIYIAFIQRADALGDTEEYLESAGIPFNILSEAIYGSNNVFADAVLIYRCWIVWGKRFSVIALPTVVLGVSSVCATLTVYRIGMNGPMGTVFAHDVRKWATAYFTLALATNIAVTALIAYRIYQISKSGSDLLANYRSKKYRFAMGIIIESGSIYVAVMLATVVLFVNGYYAKLIPFEVLGQVMGIVPTLIIVRVGLGQSIEYGQEDQDPSGTHQHLQPAGYLQNHRRSYENYPRFIEQQAIYKSVDRRIVECHAPSGAGVVASAGEQMQQRIDDVERGGIPMMGCSSSLMDRRPSAVDTLVSFDWNVGKLSLDDIKEGADERVESMNASASDEKEAGCDANEEVDICEALAILDK